MYFNLPLFLYRFSKTKVKTEVNIEMFLFVFNLINNQAQLLKM